MNWLKRLLNLFKSDEEQQADIEHQDERENSNTVSSSRLKMQHGRDVEAKIAYQYPKGKFRFPLIPDEEPIRENRTFPQVAKEWHHHETRTDNKGEVHKVSENYAAKPKVAETVQTKKKTEKIIRSNRPFTPTKVPSPVYGFMRPDKVGSHESVEYELSTFERENNPKSAQVENIPAVEEELAEFVHHSTEPAVFVRPMHGIDSPAAATEAVNEEQEFYLKQERLSESIAIENEFVQEELVAAEENYEVEETAVGLETVETVEAEPAAIEGNDEWSEPEVEDPSMEEVPEEIQVSFELDERVSEEEIENKESDAIEENDVLIEPEVDMEAKVESAVIQQEPEEMEMASEQESVQDIPAPVVAKPAANPQRSSASEQTVPHLPFNVIMLKQDKRKLEQKRQIAPASQKKETDEQKVLPLKEPVARDVYKFPPLDLLSPPLVVEESDDWIEEQREILNSTLINFNVGAQVVNVTQGPSVTRFEVQPEPGVKVNKITNLSDDLKLSLAARDIRIEAPIPGKHTIGIEVPNRKSRPVLLSEIVKSAEFTQNESPLTAALGLDISGKPIVTDLRKMPHGLIAGATGSGKSVCINSILVSLLYKAKPEELKLLLIDPKMVELAPYNQIPHLVSPVITDVKAATASLKWAVDEMERRYELFAHTGVRDIHRFNEKAMEHKQYADKLPYIVIIIDELADLMMMSPADVEEAICRIAQKARACGIHLIIATQRPSVDVITGLIKANVPTRIAFSVSSQVDSRTIIDISGAEKLLGKGDMLFLENGSSKPFRLQGTFVSDQEIDEVVAFARKQGEPNYLFEQEELLKKAQISDDEDELFYEACEFVIAHGGASTSSLQRRFKIGYNRAARLIDMMEEQGYISESKGSKPRDVLITEEELETLQESSVMN